MLKADAHCKSDCKIQMISELHILGSTARSTQPQDDASSALYRCLKWFVTMFVEEDQFFSLVFVASRQRAFS